jgi:hypothetical protein
MLCVSNYCLSHRIGRKDTVLSLYTATATTTTSTLASVTFLLLPVKIFTTGSSHGSFKLPQDQRQLTLTTLAAYIFIIVGKASPFVLQWLCTTDKSISLCPHYINNTTYFAWHNLYSLLLSQTLRVSIKRIIITCLYKRLKLEVKMEIFARSHTGRTI